MGTREDAGINLRLSLPSKSLRFTKGNTNRGLSECQTAISYSQQSKEIWDLVWRDFSGERK